MSGRRRDQEEEQRLVDQLRAYQLEKLSKYRRKGHWGADFRYDLLAKLRWEVGELHRAMNHGATPENIARECADVANYAAMIADVVLATSATTKATPLG